MDKTCNYGNKKKESDTTWIPTEKYYLTSKKKAEDQTISECKWN